MEKENINANEEIVTESGKDSGETELSEAVPETVSSSDAETVPAGEDSQAVSGGENPQPDSISPVSAGKVSVYRLTVLILAVLTAVIRSLAVIFSFDPDPGYFVSGAFLPGLAGALIAVGIVWCLSSAFLIPKGTLPVKPSFSSGKVYFAGVYAAFIMISDACYRTYGFFQSDYLSTVKAAFDSGSSSYITGRYVRIAAIMTVICIISSIGSAACFFMRAENKKNRAGAIIGLFPIIRATGGIALTHFDMTVTMNSPIKIMTELSLMAAMIYFLYEDRFELSADRARPRLYFTTALAAQFMCLVSGLSGITGYFSGAVTNGELVIESLFLFTVFFYILARLSAYCTANNGPDETGGEEENAPAGDAGEQADDCAQREYDRQNSPQNARREDTALSEQKVQNGACRRRDIGGSDHSLRHPVFIFRLHFSPSFDTGPRPQVQPLKLS